MVNSEVLNITDFLTVIVIKFEEYGRYAKKPFGHGYYFWP